MLLERPGEVVTREELRGRLWPADTYVDFDHSLNAAVRRLRDALGDSAENPRFVETVARRGYRLLAPVAGPPVVPAPPTVPEVSSRRWRVVVPVLVLIVGLALGWVIARWGRNRPAPQITQRRLTANPQENPVLGAVISPDGKYLAFSDNTGFYLRETETGETHALQVPSGFNATPDSWYPDGTHLVASWAETAKTPSGLWEVSIMGGAPRKLIDDGRMAAVSPDGSQIAFVRGASLGAEIWIMRDNGESPRGLVSRTNRMFGHPAWSPDGRRIAFVAGDYLPDSFETNTSIGAFDLATGQEDVVVADISRNTASHAEWDATAHVGRGLVWTRDNHLVYSISEPPPNQADSNLWSMPVDSRGHSIGSPVRLTATPDDVSNVSASTDGRHIVFTKFSLDPDVYVTELTGPGLQLSPPQRLTLDDRKDYPFSWTADSKTVIFASDRDGVFHIFKQAIDQTVPETLVSGDRQAMTPRLTPDDSALVFIEWPKLGKSARAAQLMRVPVAGGPAQTLLTRVGIGNVECAQAPSNLCLFDSRTVEQLAFFRFDPLTGQSQELPDLTIHDQPPYIYNWSLSPDGKILATGKKEGVSNDPTITFISLENGARRTVTAKEWAGISSIDFAADSRSLWAPVYSNTRKWALLNIDLEGKTTTVLEDSNMTIGWAIPAPDGKHLAIWKARGTSNVWMLEGF